MSSKFPNMSAKFQSLLEGNYRPTRRTELTQPQSEVDSKHEMGIEYEIMDNMIIMKWKCKLILIQLDVSGWSR